MPETPDVPPLFAGAAVIRLATAIGARAAEVRDALGLTAAELRVLQRSRDAPAMGLLAARLGAPKSTVTSVVDQLVARGLASREPDEDDRRRQIVRTTRRGMALLARFDATVADRAEDLVSGLARSDRARLGELLARVPASDPPSSA